MNATPPSMAFEPRQTSVAGILAGSGQRLFMAVERGLESEREQLGLWIPVGLGVGIAAWITLPNALQWLAFCCCGIAAAFCGMMLPAGGRLRQSIMLGGLLAAFGCVLIWC